MVRLSGGTFVHRVKGDRKRYGEMISSKKKVVRGTEFNWDTTRPSVSHFRGEVGGFELMLELMLMYANLDLG